MLSIGSEFVVIITVVPHHNQERIARQPPALARGCSSCMDFVKVHTTLGHLHAQVNCDAVLQSLGTSLMVLLQYKPPRLLLTQLMYMLADVKLLSTAKEKCLAISTTATMQPSAYTTLLVTKLGKEYRSLVVSRYTDTNPAQQIGCNNGLEMLLDFIRLSINTILLCSALHRQDCPSPLFTGTQS